MDKELKHLIQTGEGYHLEFKESLDKSIIEEVCAFANSSGGKVLLGVSESINLQLVIETYKIIKERLIINLNEKILRELE